jgi:YHS domain-containing protein
MLRFLIVEVVVPILIFLFLRSVFRHLMGSRSRPSPAPEPPREHVVAGGELKKDPVCGTYVSAALSVTRKVDGEVIHFCSKECRDKYHAA